MALRNRMFKKFPPLPTALIMVGVMLTIAWIVLIIWLPLHLLEIV
jgi:hypothetical protein